MSATWPIHGVSELHLLFAFVVVAGWYVSGCFSRSASGAESRTAGLRRRQKVLIACLVLQLMPAPRRGSAACGSVVLRGEETAPRVLANSAAWQPAVKWMTNFIFSSHYAVGALLFGTSVVVNLLLYRPRQVVLPARPALESVPQAEVERNGEHVQTRMESVVAKAEAVSAPAPTPLFLWPGPEHSIISS